MANAISVPLTGWLTQRFGAVRLFSRACCCSCWLLAVRPCANAGDADLFRVLQGLVAGPMIPLSQTLLLSSYPRAQAGMALAIWS